MIFYNYFQIITLAPFYLLALGNIVRPGVKEIKTLVLGTGYHGNMIKHIKNI